MKKASKDKEEIKERYNEKKAVKTFLNSEKGINLLISHSKTHIDTLSNDENVENKKDVLKCFDAILDFYSAWIYDCPAKSFYRKSYYHNFKKLEKYCTEEEIISLFDYLF